MEELFASAIIFGIVVALPLVFVLIVCIGVGIVI